MDIRTIPVEDKFILYRPLLRLAFVGNASMARLVLALANGGASAAGELPVAIHDYLEGIGFLEPDPEPPQPRGLDYTPVNAVILSTNRCNLRCVYCYAGAGDAAPVEVSPDLACQAIDVAHQNALALGRAKFRLTFHGGGEPTLAWETLEKAVGHARAQELPCRITIVSNGALTERQVKWIVQNLDSITISMDGSPGTQDRQRPLSSGKGSSDTVLRTITLLDELGYDYAIRLTALAPWRGQLARDVRYLCEETACRSFQVEPAFGDQRGAYRSPTPQEGADFVDGFLGALDVVERAGCRLRYSGARPRLLTSSFCSAPYGAIIVTPAGDLVTCYEVTDASHPLAAMCTIGRIQDGRVELDEEVRRVFLSNLEARRGSCRDCFCYYHCAGDCHVKTFYPGLDTEPVTSVRCQINQAIVTQLLLRYIAASPDGVWRGPRKETGVSARSAKGGQ